MDRRPDFSTVSLSSCSNCLVRRFALCEPLALEQLDVLRSRDFVLDRKQYLYGQGEKIGEVYTLCRGWVMLYRVFKDGKRQVIRIALPGDFMGACSDYHRPSRHSAICLMESTFCAFPPLTKIAKTHSELAARIISLCGETIALNNDYLTCVGQRTAIERVAFLALDLYQRLTRQGLNRADTIVFPLTQEDIADALGLTVVHVNRVLHSLADRGLVTIKHHELTVLDHEGLGKLADLE